MEIISEEEKIYKKRFLEKANISMYAFTYNIGKIVRNVSLVHMEINL